MAQGTDELRAALQANLENFLRGGIEAEVQQTPPVTPQPEPQQPPETPSDPKEGEAPPEPEGRPRSDYVRRSRRGRPAQVEGIPAAATTVTRLTRARGRTTGPKLPKGWMDTFLLALADVPIVGDACKQAGVSRATVYRYRTRLAAFARLWAVAIENGLDNAEAELWRRGVKGVPRAVYGNLGAGMGTGVVGAVTEYSDRALELTLKAHRPEKYRERFEVEQTQGTEVDAEIIELARQLNTLALSSGQPVPQE